MFGTQVLAIDQSPATSDDYWYRFGGGGREALTYNFHSL